jgi:hypothetical protein
MLRVESGVSSGFGVEAPCGSLRLKMKKISVAVPFKSSRHPLRLGKGNVVGTL